MVAAASEHPEQTADLVGLLAHQDTRAGLGQKGRSSQPG